MSAFYGIRAFAATGATGADCPAPGASGWNPLTGHTPASLAWCDCMYPSNVVPDLNRKCKVGPSFTNPGAAAAPWTTYGKNARGLPDDSLLGNLLNKGIEIGKPAASQLITQTSTPTTAPATPPPPPDSSWTNPETAGSSAMKIGGAMLALAVGAVILKKARK